MLVTELKASRLAELYGVSRDIANNWKIGRTKAPDNVIQDMMIITNMLEHIQKSNNITRKTIVD